MRNKGKNFQFPNFKKKKDKTKNKQNVPYVCVNMKKEMK